MDNIKFYHLGNGICVCDSNVTINGDFLQIAHINKDRQIKYRINVSNETIKLIENYAQTQNPSISYSQQDQKVFSNIV